MADRTIVPPKITMRESSVNVNMASGNMFLVMRNRESNRYKVEEVVFFLHNPDPNPKQVRPDGPRESAILEPQDIAKSALRIRDRQSICSDCCHEFGPYYFLRLRSNPTKFELSDRCVVYSDSRNSFHLRENDRVGLAYVVLESDSTPLQYEIHQAIWLRKDRDHCFVP